MRHYEKHKGILLAGGRGTRLYPLTAITSKQLVAIYNKPMIYYSLTTLMLAGIREILVISTPEDLPRFEALLGTGEQWGMSLEYAVQDQPRGIAEALVIGADFSGADPSMLMLGDNLFYGRFDFLRLAMEGHGDHATVFAYQVGNPSEYGVVEFGSDGHAVSLEEKPEAPRSRWAVPGIYLYPPGVGERVKAQQPSARGELEITDLNRAFLNEGRLKVQPLGRGIAWFDTGTPRSLLEASNFIEAVEQRQGLIIGSPEEVAYRMGFIDLAGFNHTVSRLPGSSYREYLERVPDEMDSVSGFGT